MDPRTGLGRFRDFRISNYQLMMQLIDDFTTKSIEEILETPGRRRARRALPRARRRRRSTSSPAAAPQHGNLVVLDLRDEDAIYATNRFMIYALFPECNISIHVLWGLQQQNTVFATGKSILDRTSRDRHRRADARLRRRRPRARPAPARSPTTTPSACSAS